MNVKNGVITAESIGQTLVWVQPCDSDEIETCIKVNVVEKHRKIGDVLAEDIPSDGIIPEGLWIAGINAEGYPYTGAAVKPEPRVYDGDKLLKKGKDYTVAYARNAKAYETAEGAPGFDAGKAPAITIKGKGNYTGTETKNFRILKMDVSGADIIKTFTDAYAVTANRKNPKLVFRMKYKGKTLKKGKDYSLSVLNSNGQETTSYAAEGSYILLVKGAGNNYTGECRMPFEVARRIPVSKLKIGRIAAVSCDGTEKKPEPTVKYGKKTLVKDTDYTLRYQDNREIGTASVVITGIGEYFGTKKVSFAITGRQMKKVSFSGFRSSISYNGVPVYQNEVVLSYDGQRLKEGTDYTVTYGNSLNVGKVTVTYSGKGVYTGTVKKSFRIVPYSLAEDPGQRLELDGAQITTAYEKGGVKPGVKLYDGDSLLQEGRDYTLTYKYNTAISETSSDKSPVITIKGKGNYKGTFGLKKNFSISAKELSEVSVSASDIVVGSKKYTSIPTLTDTNGKTLKAGTDYDKNYTYTYKNQTTVKNSGADVTRAAGDAVDAKDVIPAGTVLCVRVTAKTGGNYTGSATAEYRVTQSLITKAKITVKNPGQSNRNLFPYTGKAVTIDQSCLTVKVGDHILTNDEYEILEDTYKNNINRGTASVRIRGKGDYGGTVTVKFNVGARGFRWFWRLF